MAKAAPDSASLIMALAWRLREVRIRTGPSEFEQAAAVLSTQDTWSKEDLRKVLLPVFCKRPEQRDFFEAILDELLSSPEAAVAVRETRGGTISPPPPPGRLRPPPPFIERIVAGLKRVVRFLRRTAWAASLLVVVALMLLLVAFVIEVPGALRSGIDGAASLLGSVADAISDPFGYSLIDTEDQSGDVALFMRHAIVSALVASAAVASLLAARLVWPRHPTSPMGRGDLPPDPLTGDGSVFRVGSLGGRPPRFLSDALATEIAELLSYRETDSDRRQLDLRLSLDRHVRGDAESLVYARRKELPSILILADVTSDARYWNSTADEFVEALARRGLRVERFNFTSSFFDSNQAGVARSVSLASAIEAAATSAGWTMTVIFADLRRLSRRDGAFLANLREHGPVFAFDYSDTRLWDRRHELIMTLGVPVWPATGAWLRSALASAFAPDQSAIQTHDPGRAGSVKATFEGLSEAHAEWAAVCATVQPVSFAMAEKLRRAHEKIAGDEEVLAFSILANLHGSWVGPEGLHFSPGTRRRLLSHVRQIPRAQQFAFLNVLDEAFGAEPEGTTAAELWRYTRARAELFSPRQARATQDLIAIRASSLVDQVQFDDFVSRLRQPGEADQPDAIALPFRSSRISALIKRSSEPERIGQQRDTIAADWSLGLSEMRVRLGGEGATAAAFLSGGRNILVVEGGVTDGQTPFRLINTARGLSNPIVTKDAGSNVPRNLQSVAELVAIPQSEMGLMTTRSGQVFAFRHHGGPTSSQTELSASLSLREITSERAAIAGRPLVSLSPSGTLVAFCGPASEMLFVAGTEEGQRTMDMSLPDRISAVTFVRPDRVMVGLANGNVFNVAVIEGRLQFERETASFGLEIAALTEVVVDDVTSGIVVVALADGRILTTGSSDSSFANPALPWRPERLIAFPDRSAALMLGVPVGMSIAALGPNGEFDVVGVPLATDTRPYQGESLLNAVIDPARDGIAVLAVNAERRRMAVRNGPYVEVRPLLYDLPEPRDSATRTEDPDAPAKEWGTSSTASPPAELNQSVKAQ